MEEAYPNKTCDYCMAVGKAYTFMTNETICHKCLMSVPTEPRLLRKEVFALRARIAELEAKLAALVEKAENVISWDWFEILRYAECDSSEIQKDMKILEQAIAAAEGKKEG